MNFRRSDGVERPADRAEAERLLDAARSADPAPAGDEPLARLLSAAAAPARPGELAGEEAALAAFRAARAAGASAPAPAPPSRRRRRVTTGVVAWVAGIAATATAGAAFAAVTLDRGDEPAPAPRPPASVPGGSGSDPGAPSSSGGGPTTGTPSAGPSAASPSGGPGVSGEPASEGMLAGQCRAYLAKPAAQREKALRSPTFADLVAAAGGAGKVEAYCRELLPEQAPDADESPTARPSRSPAAPAAPTPDPRPSRKN
ncbi:hypothetical protein [Micromonospora purpureochromogenes]|uniref:Meckel syndrome type 1 protein n=1 Tax=Micromonospora purpureochromogenes TaxID=47872 RepID=A0ABX2RTW9_9ACTN|nr:hypothetical protein [Micromonospora purpureochromogenes]NYF59513.1 hypothetical protein [Micromonospora purpureochromogenes]